MLLYDEQKPTRIGWTEEDSVAYNTAETPYLECDFNEIQPPEKCFAATPSIDMNQALEWAGQWSLPKGKYQWTLRAEGTVSTGKDYHEPKMDIYAVQGTDIDGAHFNAETEIMKEGQPNKVKNGAEIKFDLPTKQTLILDENGATTTTYTLNIRTAGDYILFTEHMPWEFASTALEATNPKEGEARYFWAVEARDYVLADAQSVWVDVNASDAGTDSGRTPAPATTEDPSEAGKTDDQKNSTTATKNCKPTLQSNCRRQPLRYSVGQAR